MTIDSREVCRYLGEREGLLGTMPLISACSDTLLKTVEPIAVRRVFPVEQTESGVSIGGALFFGTLVKKHLAGCASAALYAVTLGYGAEQLIAQADLLRALILDAAATVMLQSACRDLEEKIREEAAPLFTAARISPGYGDLPLCSQKELLCLLQAEKYAGICLSECYALCPSKTLTGIVGLTRQETSACGGGCAACNLRNGCAYRRD